MDCNLVWRMIGRRAAKIVKDRIRWKNPGNRKPNGNTGKKEQTEDDMPKKMSRAERKAEEARIIAEMEEAMAALKKSRNPENAEQAGADLSGAKPQQTADTAGPGPEQETSAGNAAESNGPESGAKPDPAFAAETDAEKGARCPKCGGKVKRGVCSRCGHYEYVPPDEKTVRRIRLIVGVICVAVFFVWMLANSIKG